MVVKIDPYKINKQINYNNIEIRQPERKVGSVIVILKR